MKKIVVIGSSNTDLSVKGRALPRPGETVFGEVFTIGQGGREPTRLWRHPVSGVMFCLFVCGLVLIVISGN